MIKIGHRGAAGLAPENTLASFQKAIELGVDMMEFDVHLCQSGEVVAIHDPKVDRTTDGTGEVSQKSLTQLKDLDAGQGQKIPTLSEVLDLIDQRTGLVVELKGPGTAKPVHQIIQNYINRFGWFYDDFIIISFDHDQLLEFSHLGPKFRLGPIFKVKPVGYAELVTKLSAYSIHLTFEYIDQNFIQDAHKRNLKVIAWTVNEPKDINHLKSLGVDGITSDYPDRFSW